MLDAKDVARKIANGCGHTATVVVPCSGCIEGQMKAWESSVREHAKMQFRDEWQQMADELAKAIAEAKRLGDQNDSLAATVRNQVAANVRLEGLLKEAQAQVADLNARLAAEQGMKQTVKMFKQTQKAATR